MELSSGLSTFADSHGFVVAYGQGDGNLWNAGDCCGGDKADDLSYLRAVVTTTEHLVRVDPTRVYVIGMSNGGMMAYRAECEEPGLFAAAGNVAGALLADVPCSHTIVHVYDIHGTADTTVPLDGGIGFEHIDFPSMASEKHRVAPNSIIVMKTWHGGHAYPAWATKTLWAWLSKWRS